MPHLSPAARLTEARRPARGVARRWWLGVLLLGLTACDFPGTAPTPVPVLPSATLTAAPALRDTPTPPPPVATATPVAAAPPLPVATATPVASSTPLPVAATRPATPPPKVVDSPTPIAAVPVGRPPTPIPARAPPAGPTPGPRRGGYRYIFPVQPADGTNYGPYHHDYPAVDIFTPIGSRFVAPTDGAVDWVSRVDTWDPRTDDPAVRGGLSVAIIGADGVRYYGSHLSAVAPGIAPGVRVAAGQLLGYTGHSGDARFVAPHLHFGISHPTTPSDWHTRRGEVSPYPYLRAWAAGRPVTPQLGP